MGPTIRRYIPLFVLLLLLIGLYLTSADKIFTLKHLQAEEKYILQFSSAHPYLVAPLYFLIYTVSVALMVPDSTLLTLLGGQLFPIPIAILLASIAETAGAAILFLIFSTTLGKKFLDKERPLLKKIRSDFQSHAPSYLLFLRLSHLFPFWVTSVGAAYFKIPLVTFLWTTFLGVLPLTYLFVDAGHSLQLLFKKGEPIHMGDIFNFKMKIALLALGLSALIPVLINKYRKRRKGS